jgi:hypothetical protein
MKPHHSKENKKHYFMYALLALVFVWAGYFTVKSVVLQNSLKDILSKEQHVEQKIKRYQELQRIDSILVQGNYSSALQAYTHEYNNKDFEDIEGVQLRIQLAEHLLTIGENESPKNIDSIPSQNQDSLNIQTLPHKRLIEKQDSLNFALQKATIHIANLSQQLKHKSFGEYLTFKNSKGSQMHYVGQVKENMANGYGVAILNTGSRYEGFWHNNLKHGEGTFHWADGEYYLGSYQNDQRNGEGTYFWPNGEKYVGQWKNDKRNGHGVFYGADGEILTEGEWENDKLITKKQKAKKP